MRFWVCRWVSIIAVAVLLLCVGCAERGDSARDAATVEPESTFARLEKELLEADHFALEYSITSEGAFESSLSGTLAVQSGNILTLNATGTFGAEAFEAVLRSDGEMMWMTFGTDSSASQTPQALNEGVVLGLTRMGLLHNLARLVGGAPPDRTDGSVREWVTVGDFAVPDSADAQAGTPVSFSLTVAGEPSGNATLWIDDTNWLPVLRRQRVRFPQGEMVVVERFRQVPAP